jgi:hypothetical protein
MAHEARCDTAMALARHVVELFANCLREEEWADAVCTVYQHTLAALECYDIHTKLTRLAEPSEN